MAEAKYLDLTETKFETEAEWSITTVFQNHMYKCTKKKNLHKTFRSVYSQQIQLSQYHCLSLELQI